MPIAASRGAAVPPVAVEPAERSFAADGSRTARAQVTWGRACLGPPRTRRVRRRAPGPTRLEKLLTGVAVTLCSATVVVVLGLVADLAGGAHAGPPTPPSVSVAP